MISIIIPTYNRANKLKSSLMTVLAQSYKEWECLVIDDGSSDHTKEVMSMSCFQDPRFKFLIRPKNLPKGPSSCRNFGLTRAQGDYIQFFDDDDYMFPEMLETKLIHIQETESEVVVAPLEYFNVEKDQKEGQNKVFSTNIVHDYILGEISWYISGPMWRKSFIVERFDESVQTLDDWDFNLRNIYKHPKVGYLKKPLQRYNRSDFKYTLSGQEFSRGKDQNFSAFIVYKKHYELLLCQDLLTSSLKDRLIQRVVYLLRDSLANRKPTSTIIYEFFTEAENNFSLRFAKIFLGYWFYKIFNRGYRLIK